MKKIIALTLALVLAIGLFAGCGPKTDDITIAATPVPHAEILKIVKTELEKDGWTLDIKVYNDYVQPNNVVEDGEIDANYFQHTPYLEQFNADNGTHLVSVAQILRATRSPSPTTAPTVPVVCCCWRPRV